LQRKVPLDDLTQLLVKVFSERNKQAVRAQFEAVLAQLE